MKKTFRYISALLLALMLAVSLSAPAMADAVRHGRCPHDCRQ